MLRYLLESGNVENTFSLLQDGRLYLTTVPSQDTYQLTVRVVDGGSVPKFDTAVINVFVNETGCVPFDTTLM